MPVAPFRQDRRAQLDRLIAHPVSCAADDRDKQLGLLMLTQRPLSRAEILHGSEP